MAERDETKHKLQGVITVVETVEMPADVMCCQFSPDGHVLAVGLCNGLIQLLNPISGSILHVLADDTVVESRLPVTQMRYFPAQPGQPPEHHLIISSYASGYLKFWNYDNKTCINTIKEERQILALDISSDGTHLISAGGSTTIRLYDVIEQKQIHQCSASDVANKVDGHVYNVFSARYNYNHPFNFITGGWDDTVQYWDERQQHSVKNFCGPHICGDAIDINLASDQILTGSWRKERVLQIWDFKSGKLLHNVPQDKHHRSQLYCAKYIDKDHIVSGGTSENLASIIELKAHITTGQIFGLPHGVYCIDCENQTKVPKIAVGSGHHIYILKC